MSESPAGTVDKGPAAPSSGSPGSATASPASTPIASGSPAAAAKSAGSALESLERIAARPAEPSSSSAPPLDPAGRSGPTEPATGAGVSGSPHSSPPREAPEPRIVAAVKNAREALEGELGWARTLGVPKAEVQRYVSLGHRLDQDPRSFYAQLGQELGITHEEGTGRRPAEPVPEPFTIPEGDLFSEDRTQRAYSEKSMRKIITDLRADIVREVRGEYQPAIEFATAGRSAQEDAEVRAQAAETARQAITHALTLPHFRENQQLISEELAKIDPTIRHQVGSVAAMYMAYNKVLAERVLPVLGQQRESQTIADLQRSATAGSTVVGTQAAPRPKPSLRDGNLDDLARHMEQLAGGASAHA